MILKNFQQPVPEFSNFFHADDEEFSTNGDYLPPKKIGGTLTKGYQPAAQWDPDSPTGSPTGITDNDLYMEPDGGNSDGRNLSGGNLSRGNLSVGNNVTIELDDIRNLSGSGGRNNSYVFAQNRSPLGGMSTLI